MKHGELKHTIVIERPTGTAQDSAGQIIEIWQEVGDGFKASIEQLSARERFVVAQLQATATHRIRMLHTTLLSSMDASWRIVFGIRLFQLVAPPNNVRERNREIELLCVEYPAL